MSWLSDLFSPKKQELTSDRPAGQDAVGNQLGSWIEKNLANYVPGKEYEGKFTAPMAEGEAAGQDWLMKYLNQPNTGDLYAAGKDELMKTLTGKYDPASSDYYKAFRESALSQENDTIDRQRRGAGVRGSLFQDTSLRDESKTRTDTGNYLNQLLATLSEKERTNRLNAVAPAMEYEKYATSQPYLKAMAGTSVGSLPRLIEQNDLEMRYKDFLRKQEEYGKIPGTAQSYYGTQGPNYGLKSYETASPFERIMGTVADMGGKVASAYMGNPFAFLPTGSSASSGGGSNSGGYSISPGWKL